MAGRPLRGVVWLVPIYTPLLYCELGWGEITLETTRHVTIETKVVPWISLEYKGYERWAQGAREHKETIRGERRHSEEASMPETITMSNEQQ